MQDRIAKGIATQFEERRIIVWTDPDGEMRETYDGLELPGVTKIELANNEFGVKHRVLRQEPKAKFLLYRSGPRPTDINNWILDIELAHGAFKADQTAIWRTELGLPDLFDPVFAEHGEFFRSTKRLERLKGLIRETDTPSDLRRRMLAICAGTDGDLDTVLEALLADLATDSEETLRLITRVGLEKFLWQQVKYRHGYAAAEPCIKDYALWLFSTVHRAQTDEDVTLAADASVFFGRWQNGRLNHAAFDTLSAMAASELDMESKVAPITLRKLVDANAFELLDQYLIKQLCAAVVAREIPTAEVRRIVWARRPTFWYDRYKDLYEAIGFAAEFHEELTRANLGVTSMDDGVSRYAQSWFRIDQHYRKFILHMRRAAQASLMQPLFEQVENHYVNHYLTRLNEAWQQQVDKAETWTCGLHASQTSFFVDEVGGFRRKGQRICVIISDAFRYECAHELVEKIRTIDRYDAEIKPALGALPSYTQLGMAALLPHKSLAIADNESSTVLVDGQNSVGLDARLKLLNAGRTGDRADAMRAEDFMALTKDDARTRVSECDVLYIYHNQIDATGDKIATEDRTFEAVEDTLEDIVKLVKKLSGANASNVLVTADHGFLYQHRPIEESDFSSSEIHGETVLSINRRFVLGHGLQSEHGLAHFTPARLGLAGTVEALVPKSINRLRRQGSGSRFVHGGATLQEVVVPVVTISKKRTSDVTKVDVTVISPSRPITAGQYACTLYQETAATEKVHPRTLRIALWSLTGQMISDMHMVSFELRSENARDREISIRLLLTRDADQFNGSDVVLKLEEQIEGTSQFRTFKEARYKLQRSIATDFDF